MEEIKIKYSSTGELWHVFDKNLDHILIHKFCPQNESEWWTTDLKTRNGMVLNDLSVRRMEMDVQTDLERLKRIISLKNDRLMVSQFDRQISDLPEFEKLPDSSVLPILKLIGLKHYFNIIPEYTTVSSYDVDFIHRLKENSELKSRL